ncbi:Rrf2 family transcriptional regulator [Paenibacillus bovis]|uniref:Rrf2 family transcriptional regulator n=1 Tax=Paenibacillus bovis TaxID=1616788 RepID=A0A172ZB65_9BACL|nr:Rrf2 family transcriptional regulator [Paenibacillus bovis]ANF94759.1 Rrf2 family transcriptional regulator [Paenibacillus bovis]
MKQISTRFSMAVHTLSLIDMCPLECTGDFIAASVNTNPVVIRRIMSMLKKAGLIEVRAGVGGAYLLRKPEQITLLDIYRAVHAADENQLFGIHGDSNIACPVGRSIEQVLQQELLDAQHVMEQRLARTTLDQLNEQFAMTSSSIEQ